MRRKNYVPDPCHVPALSYFLGKPVSYWYDLEKRKNSLELINSALYDDLKVARLEIQHLERELDKPKSPAYTPLITTYLGKPLEYWAELQNKYINVLKENKNLQERIDKANDELCAFRNLFADGV